MLWTKSCVLWAGSYRAVRPRWRRPVAGTGPIPRGCPDGSARSRPNAASAVWRNSSRPQRCRNFPGWTLQPRDKVGGAHTGGEKKAELLGEYTLHTIYLPLIWLACRYRCSRVALTGGILSSLLKLRSSSTSPVTLKVLGGMPLSVSRLWAILTYCSCENRPMKPSGRASMELDSK